MPLSKAELTGSVNPVLTEHARRLRPTQFIAEDVFPSLMKPGLLSGQLQVWDSSNLEVPTDAARSIGAPAVVANEANPTYITYNTKRYGRKLLHTTREDKVALSSGQDPDLFKAAKVNKLVDQLMLLRERDLSSKLNTAANYESGYSTSLSTTWAAAGGDPIGNIETGLKKGASGGVYFNVAIMDYQVWITLARHSALVELTKYVAKGALTEEAFMSIFGLRPIIGKSVYSASGTISPVWEDSCILAYINPSLMPVGESDMTFGRTIVEKEMLVTEYDAPDRDQDGAVWIETEMGFAHQFIGVDNATDGDSIAGYLIDNAI